MVGRSSELDDVRLRPGREGDLIEFVLRVWLGSLLSTAALVPQHLATYKSDQLATRSARSTDTRERRPQSHQLE